MAVKVSSPQVSALCLAAEKRFGRRPVSRSDFSDLSSEIERVTSDHMAESTLRRIWGVIKGYDTVFVSTLNVIAKYSGYEHWEDFCECQKHVGSIKVSELVPGGRIRLGWAPDRKCVVEFAGGRTFRVVEASNSLVRAGDSFECDTMILHFPLFADNLVHDGELCRHYVVGLKDGLNVLEKLF